MFSDESELLSVIERFQLAALGEGAWLDAVGALARATGSRTGQMIGLGADAAVPFNWMTEMPPEASDHFVAVGGGDPRVNRRVGVGASVPELRVVADGDFAAYGRADDPPELTAWFDRFDVPHICLSPLLKQDGLLVGLAVLRSGKDGHITARQRRVFAHLAPHVRAAVRTQLVLQAQGPAVVAGAMEALAMTAFVCDARGRVLARTPSTEPLLGAGRHLRLRGGVLTACNETDGKALSAAVYAAGSPAGVGRPAGSVVLTDALAGDPLLIEVASLPTGRHAFGSGQAVLIIVGARRTAEGRTAALARALYGLTSAEAAVIGDLVAGLGPQAIADRRGTSVTTVRTHIRRIFEKAGVNSQIELVADVNRRL